MCYRPITLKNPNYKLGFFNEHLRLKDCHSSNMTVPCGHCQQCFSLRQAKCNQRVQMESLRSHLFFLTLTYNDESIMTTDIGQYQVAYPHYQDVQNMIKMMRKNGHRFRYWFVSEYGSKKKRPHYHAIIAFPKEDWIGVDTSVIEQTYYYVFLQYWRRNYGSTRKPIWRDLLTLVRSRGRSTYDFHHIVPIPGHDNDLSFYISKYVLHYDSRTDKLLQKIQLDPDLSDVEKLTLWSQIKPKSQMSKDFGSRHDPQVQEYIKKKCIPLNPIIPQFIDLNTGQTSMLSPYYQPLVPDEYYRSRYENYSDFKDQYSFGIIDNESFKDCSANIFDVDKFIMSEKRIRNLCGLKY